MRISFLSKRRVIMALTIATALPGLAQQSNINLSYNPQKDTEGLVPFSAPLNSPQVNDDHTVIFRVKAPEAKSVGLNGAMLTVMHERGPLPFTKGEDGIWTLKIGPLPVDMYQYNIVIDGVSCADPNNQYAAFTAMPPYSELIVHGDGPQWYDARDVPHGSITRHIYYSSVTKGQRDMYVYTPPQYDPTKKYPVLYLMGGSGELPSNWMYDGRVNFIMDNLLAEGQAKPMIIAIINNQVVHRNHPQHADLTFEVMARELREVIIPFVDSHYPTIANPHGRALSGLSMGGRHTMFCGLRNLDLFANLGILSAGEANAEKELAEFLNDPKANEKVDYLFVGQGTEEEKGFFNLRVKGLVDALKNHNINHEYYAGGIGGHDWATWRHLLYYRFLRRVFNEHTQAATIPFLDADKYQTIIDGQPVKLYNISNGKVAAQITNLGGFIVSLFAPDKDGQYANLVTSYPDIEKYKNYNLGIVGPMVGRYANRIANGRFTLDGVEYEVTKNNGAHTLHGGTKGFDHTVWKVLSSTVDQLTMECTLPDGTDGFPGTLTTRLTYSITADDGLSINFTGTTDKATVVNNTCHSYFNLDGVGLGDIMDYQLTISADSITETDRSGIPSGKLIAVEGTLYDFRNTTRLGDRLAEFKGFRPGQRPEIPEGKLMQYDNNFCLLHKDAKAIEKVVTLYSPKSGRQMEVWNNHPGIQIYTGFGRSIALESQMYPDSPNHPNFPSTVLRPGENYSHTCIYKFSVKSE